MERDNNEISNYVISNIDAAITNEYIKVYFQPVVRTISKKLCGMEALARWIDPEIGFLSPADFIPALEESGEIYKLDLYVAEKVCENYRRVSDAKDTPVPVSFNLSRIDFEKTDIFSEIENDVKKYDVPRDMINIEITESMVIKDSEKIYEVIKKFREAGYLVWMDDFGSGYSSLNVLKDYEFDELKIDMEFLRTFTDRSKEIIRSIVYMAKLIGVQTLAEGVETEEQYEFLRKIGCEKIQGYYFGKPMPYEESIRQITDRNIKIEKRSWRSYYDAIGNVNFLMDSPLAIVEYDGENFNTLFSNKAFRKTLTSFGIEGKNLNIINTDDGLNDVLKSFRRYANTLISSEKHDETYIYSAGKQYAKVDLKILVTKKDRTAFQVALYNISSDSDKKTRKKLDKFMRLVLSMYDEIFVLNFDDKCFEPLISSKGVSEFDALNKGFKNSLEKYIEDSVYSDDRERYKEICSASSIKKRLSESSRSYISDYFRMKDDKGNFTWKVVSMLKIPGYDSDEKILHCEKKAAIDDVSIVQELLKNFGYMECNIETRDIKERKDLLVENDVWMNLLKRSNLNIFWKDKDRRFLGASNHFLSTYGIESDTEIIGKTDEDMLWHVDDGPFMEIEKSVISEGKSYENVYGQCIIKGTVHNIYASKYPLYKDGNIVGLIGYFIDKDNFSKSGKKVMKGILIDDVTGLMNMRGVLTNLISFTEGYETRDEDFKVIIMKIPELTRTEMTYGRDASIDALKQSAAVIVRALKNKGFAGRIANNMFVIITKMTDENEINSLMHELEEGVSGIKKAAGERVTLFTKFDTWSASETDSVDDLFSRIISLK